MGLPDGIFGRESVEVWEKTMGELILCNQNMAAFPYYVEEAAIGVYSLEELSYYICHNVDVYKRQEKKRMRCVARG